MLVMATAHGDRLSAQERGVAPLLREVTGQQVVYTPSKSRAVCDGLIVEKNELTAIFELKCRNMTVEKLRSFNNEWMLSVSKVQRCANLSKKLCCPFYGALYLVPDETLYWIQITDSAGELMANYKRKNQRGRENCLSNRWKDEEVYLIPVE